MTLPLFFVGFCSLVVGVVVVVALIAWHPEYHEHRHEHHPAVSLFDWCEHEGDEPCPHPPTHELVGAVTVAGDGASSAMVATYCAEHAPPAAVRVR